MNIESISDLGAPAALMLLMNGLGWILKRTPFPNSWIPVALIGASAFIYPWIYDWGNIVLNVDHPYAVASVHGALIGMSAVGTYEKFCEIWDRFVADKKKTEIAPTPTPTPTTEVKP